MTSNGRRHRFVTPAIVRLALPDGDWIDVKRELTTGELFDLFAAMRNAQSAVDPSRVLLARAEAYLLDWSFVDQDDRPVPYSPDQLRQLDTDSWRELWAALEAHIAAIEAAAEAEKKTRNPDRFSSRNSGSVS